MQGKFLDSGKTQELKLANDSKVFYSACKPYEATLERLTGAHTRQELVVAPVSSTIQSIQIPTLL
jgi:hypothetical protein